MGALIVFKLGAVLKIAHLVEKILTTPQLIDKKLKELKGFVEKSRTYKIVEKKIKSQMAKMSILYLNEQLQQKVT